MLMEAIGLYSHVETRDRGNCESLSKAKIDIYLNAEKAEH
jgi:hypothetical protein